MEGKGQQNPPKRNLLTLLSDLFSILFASAKVLLCKWKITTILPVPAGSFCFGKYRNKKEVKKRNQ
jgi:hypothetical protein